MQAIEAKTNLRDVAGPMTATEIFAGIDIAKADVVVAYRAYSSSSRSQTDHLDAQLLAILNAMTRTHSTWQQIGKSQST